MTTATAQPRSKLSIWLIGLILGPIVLMLWSGRGRLALIYLLVQLIAIGLVFLSIANGLFAPPAVSDFELMGLLVHLPYNIAGVVHGLRIRAVSLDRPWYSRWYAAIFLPLAVSLLIPFIVREYFYQPFNAPSENMMPGLMPGDYFFARKTAYDEPKRGDIVVFKLPRDNRTTYVERLIGMPGDRIQMKEGIVHLNGEALPLTRAEGIPCMEEMRCNFFRETLPDGRSYIVNDIDPNGLVDNTAEYVVPQGHYFMMGDNRDNSLDSRFAQNAPGGGVGYVPHENLVGPVVAIFWNSYGIRIDDRLDGYPGR